MPKPCIQLLFLHAMIGKESALLLVNQEEELSAPGMRELSAALTRNAHTTQRRRQEHSLADLVAINRLNVTQGLG